MRKPFIRFASRAETLINCLRVNVSMPRVPRKRTGVPVEALSDIRLAAARLRKGKTAQTRILAATNLRRLGGDHAVASLLKGMKDPSWSVRSECVFSLMGMGKKPFRNALGVFTWLDFTKLPKLKHSFVDLDPQKLKKARVQRMAARRKAKSAKALEKWNNEYSHRNLELYIVRGLGRNAVNYKGRIVINNSVPTRFRKIIAEHELAEYFNHSFALAAELSYANQHGMLTDYMSWVKRQSTNAFNERVSVLGQYLPGLKSKIPAGKKGK